MSQTLRISGLASGLDIDSMVQQLMQAERAPLDKLEQQKQILQWQQEDYRDINTSLVSLRNSIFTAKLQSTFLAKKATSSNESALTVTATSAAEGIYQVDITQLATGVSVISSQQLPEETVNGTTQTLAKQFNLPAGTTVTFELEGTEKDSNGQYITESFTFNADTQTIYDVVAAINARNMGINASYDNTNNLFSLTSPGTGSSQHLKLVSDSVSSVSGATFLHDYLKLNLTAGSELFGKDAQVVVHDSSNTSVTYNMSSNSFSLLGLSFNLKAPATGITISVTKDVDTVVNNIKNFVNAYNDVLSKINAKLNEKRYYDYPPLTDDQKKSMSADDIKLWEEKARSGLLKDDFVLDDVAANMRSTMASIVSGLTTKYNNLSAIGITTSSDYMSEGGKLYIDESKLREAIETDMNGVMDLFTKTADATDQKGLAQRLYDVVNNAIQTISSRAGSDAVSNLADQSYIGQRLKEIDANISDWENRLNQLEDRYYNQFTAMEQAINQMNAQSLWLSQQLGIGQSSK